MCEKEKNQGVAMVQHKHSTPGRFDLSTTLIWQLEGDITDICWVSIVVFDKHLEEVKKKRLMEKWEKTSSN